MRLRPQQTMMFLEHTLTPKIINMIQTNDTLMYNQMMIVAVCVSAC